MRDILSLTRGQPLAGQIRSQRICHSLAALQGSNEPCPEGLTLRVVQHAIRFVLQLELFWVYLIFCFIYF
ncbi:hypothetical protein EFS38_03370 [Dickeya undicola]|uniref:Uncharacterized protein n=1 Tax=Dickeya undicola TaxID=1577887 RepID=A0A3N0GAC4_9GAMM|nr:hypothetical protein EF878_03270 [Dickeya undicola]RNM26795.1 hypothetical protein EFS38_03370 [Dickeya undicola]